MLKIKNNSSTTTRRLDILDQSFLQSLFSSPLLGEGIYSFEIDNGGLYFSSPSFYEQEIETSIQRHSEKYSLNNLYCYEMRFTKPSFLPIKTKLVSSLIQGIISLQIPRSEYFFQLLFTKRKDNWKQIMLNQYEQFLIGSDNPSTNKVGKRVQERIIKIADRISGNSSKRERVEDIEQKILDQGFVFEMRMILNGSTYCFEKYIEEKLNKLDFYNELRLLEITDKKSFIENFNKRRFSKVNSQQTMSQSELFALLVGDENDSTSINQFKNTNMSTKSKSFPLDALFSGTKTNREIDESIMDDISNALYKANAINNISINYTDIQKGSTLQKVTFEIPDGLTYSSISKKQQDIQAALGVESLTVEQGSEPGTIMFVLPCDEKEIVYLKDVLNQYEPNKDFILPFAVGLDDVGHPIFKCLSQLKHLLIAGATGSGKSVFLNQLILTLLLMKKSDELTMFLIDPKEVELAGFEGFPQVQNVITDAEETNKILKSLISEMDQRYKFLKEKGYKNIISYNQNHPHNKKPYVVCVIDEFADLIMANPKVEDYIVRLGQKSRAAGIHLICATQRPEAKIISGLIKANLPSKISFRCDSNVDYRTVFGKNQPYNLLGEGDGVAKLEGESKEFIRFQSPVITLDNKEEERIYKEIKEYYKNSNGKSIEVLEDMEDEPIVKIKKIIAQSGETRISKLQKEMGMRINTIQDLMSKLVDEGWLIKHKARNKGYELIVDENELEKWKV